MPLSKSLGISWDNLGFHSGFLASRSPAVAVAVAVGGIAHIAVAEAGERKNEIGVKDGW